MSGPVRVQLVELSSGIAVPLTEDGVSAGGLGADIVLWEGETRRAFVDPIDEGFVVTDGGLEVLTVNDAPVIGQRMARLGDRVAFGAVTYRIQEAVPPVVTEMVLETDSTQVFARASEEVAARTGQVPTRSSTVRSILGWLLVLVVVVGSGAAGYLVAAMLRDGR
ncbi:MAG: hypothetical protein ACKN99_04085 [Gemmatimonadota bacterium]